MPEFTEISDVVFLTIQVFAAAVKSPGRDKQSPQLLQRGVEYTRALSMVRYKMALIATRDVLGSRIKERGLEPWPCLRPTL